MTDDVNEFEKASAEISKALLKATSFMGKAQLSDMGWSSFIFMCATATLTQVTLRGFDKLFNEGLSEEQFLEYLQDGLSAWDLSLMREFISGENDPPVEHPEYTLAAWRQEVSEGTTCRGYIAWLSQKVKPAEISTSEGDA